MSVLTNNRMHTTRLRRLPMASEGPAGAASTDPLIFETIWTTDNPGNSTDFQVELPTVSGGTYDFHVDWGDGNSDDITVWNDAAHKHTYASIGTYTVQITGTCNGWAFNNLTGNGGDAPKLIEVTQWGVLELGSTVSGHFYSCSNLVVTATDAPVVGTTLENTFRSCSVFTGGVGNWDVSSVTTMSNMFRSCSLFEEISLNDWDTGAVIDMQFLFRSCPLFNGNITSWTTSAVTDMNTMFLGCIVFNQDISGWNVVLVTNMKDMFSSAKLFNQDVGSWVVSEVTDMENMFAFAEVFNQDISTWNTAKVLTMKSMFRAAGTTVFNQDIGGWDVDAVTNMQSMFQGATAFDQDIGGWDMVNKVFMADMFKDAGMSTTNYNALLIGWDSTADGTPGINFNGGSSTYNSGAPTTARASLVTKSWTITDGGQV